MLFLAHCNHEAPLYLIDIAHGVIEQMNFSYLR